MFFRKNLYLFFMILHQLKMLGLPRFKMMKLQRVFQRDYPLFFRVNNAQVEKNVAILESWLHPPVDDVGMLRR